MSAAKKPNENSGIVSLVLGILSIVFSILPFIGLPLAIVSLVFYSKQKKEVVTGAATAGLVTAIIGIIMNCFLGIFVMIGALAYFGVLSPN
jgi:hypothetical protein